MSAAINILSNNLQGYGPSESGLLPCLGFSGRAVSVSPCPRNELKTFHVKLISPNCSSKRMSFLCKASSGGQRRNPDFSRQNRQGYSRNRNRLNDERDSYENLDESEFLSTKNGPLLSLANNSPKSHATSAPGPREREIVELFKKVQTQLRERAAVKEEKKFEAVKGQTKETETVDSLLKLLRKHSAEQGKRKVNGGSTSDIGFDRRRQSTLADEDNNRSFFNSSSIVREEPQETNKPSFSRPVSNFRRRSPVPRVKYEPIVSTEDTYDSVSHLDADVKRSEIQSEPDLDPESELDVEPEMDLVAELEPEQEEELDEELVEEAETELEPETVFVDGPVAGELSDSEVLDAEGDDYIDSDTQRQLAGVKDLNSMKLVELRALAKARGMKGFSKLKKSELVGLLSDDSI